MRKNLLKSLLLVVVCITLIFSLTACAKVAENQLEDENSENTANTEINTPAVDTTTDDKTEDTSESEDSTETDDTEEDDITPVYTNPLTGEETEEDISKNRPVAVMINNIYLAMPQLGISKADIIYEMLVEGGITRMCAVFQQVDDDLILGSIRSSRHNYIDIVKAYDAVYVHAGGSDYAYADLRSRNVDSLCAVKGRGDLFYRDQERLATMAYEHTLCITGENVWKYFRDIAGTRLEHSDDYACNMIFSENVAPINGQPATKATVKFGFGKNTIFNYNPDSEKYTAYQYDEDYIDGNNNEVVEFKNIIVIQTSVVKKDPSDCKEITLTGTGNGWFICNGQISEITWSRSDNDAQFEYTYSDGSALEYGIGKTYVCVIANSGSVDFE